MGSLDYWFKDHVFKLQNYETKFGLWVSVGWGALIWGSTLFLLFYFLRLKAFVFIWMLLTEDMTYYAWDCLIDGEPFNRTYYLPCKLPFGYNEGKTNMPMKSVLFFWAFTVAQGIILASVF